jgi:mannose-1-phosphate guanylyltransferase/mannose-6-phosphate isomerase
VELYPVIMCGGSGTRLWPLSRPERPKQFIPLVGLRSTFQQTALRLSRLPGVVRPVIIAGSAHAHWIAEQLEALDLAADVLLEPTPRDSGPAVAAAAAWIARQSPAGIAVIVASDHHIPDDDAFLAAVEAAAGAAAQGSIVTLGLKPTEPSSAYGYINAGALIEGDKAVCRVAAFVEKPVE